MFSRAFSRISKLIIASGPSIRTPRIKLIQRQIYKFSEKPLSDEKSLGEDNAITLVDYRRECENFFGVFKKKEKNGHTLNDYSFDNKIISYF